STSSTPDPFGVWRGLVASARIDPWARKFIYLARSRTIASAGAPVLGEPVQRSGWVFIDFHNANQQPVARMKLEDFSPHIGEHGIDEALLFFEEQLRPDLGKVQETEAEIARRMTTLRASKPREHGAPHDKTWPAAYLAAAQLVNWRHEPSLPEIERLGFSELASWLRLLTAEDPVEPSRELLRWDCALIEFVGSEYPPERCRHLLLDLLQAMEPGASPYGNPHFHRALGQLRTCDPEGRTIPAIRELKNRSDWLEQTYVRGHLLLRAFDEEDFESLVRQLRHEGTGSYGPHPAVEAAQMLVRFVEATGRRRTQVVREIWDAVTHWETDRIASSLLVQLVRLEAPETQLLVQQFLDSEEEISPLVSMAHLDGELAGRIARKWIRRGIASRSGSNWVALSLISFLDDREITIEIVGDLLNAMEGDRLRREPWKMRALSSLRELCRTDLSDPPPGRPDVSRSVEWRMLEGLLTKQLISEGADPTWVYETLFPPKEARWMPPPNRSSRR
ncbi:MAG: hypothetical protein AAF488_16745, partial [Planctomycetota bacterium]